MAQKHTIEQLKVRKHMLEERTGAGINDSLRAYEKRVPVTSF